MDKLKTIPITLALASALVLGACSGALEASAASTKQQAFTAWAKTVRGDLAACEAASAKVGLGLQKASSSSATAADFQSGVTTAASAAPLCANSSGTGIAKLSKAIPPSSAPGLKGIITELQHWADQDDRTVIVDAGKAFASQGAPSDLLSLKADRATSDGDASTIESTVAMAAKSVGAKGFKGLGLTNWGSYTGGN
jgi:hypothetical protein